MRKQLPTIMAGAKPRFFQGNEIGCLVLHGFMATPSEVGWLGDYLAEQGYTVYVPRLTGHGTNPEHMKRIRWQEWYADALDAYSLLQQQCEKVFVIGHSMGGLLGILLSSAVAVDGLGIVAAPISVPDPLMHLTKILTPILPYTDHETDPRLQDIILKEQERRNEFLNGRVNYKQWYSGAVGELRKLINLGYQHLEQVYAPTLVLYSEKDQTVYPNDYKIILKKIKSAYIQQHILKKSDHIIFQDIERETAFAVVGKFIENLTNDIQ